jgi:hypothetical protein
MEEINDWMWLVKTNKGDFFMTVAGKWTQEEAAKNVRLVFDSLKIDIIGMIPRKRASGPLEMGCTIIESDKPAPPWGFQLLAGKNLWQVCGRKAEYDVEMILLEKETEAIKEEA